MNSLRKAHTLSARRLGCAALLLVSFALTAAAQQARESTPVAARPAQQQGVMTLDVTVVDGQGRYITGLAKEQFTLTDGGTPREITSLSDAAEPASIGVLFDISASMHSVRDNLVEDSRRAFARFYERALPQNEYFLWAFSKSVTELTGWTQNRDELNRGLDRIAPKAISAKDSGQTALYDACAAALEKLSGGSHRKRILLIFSDGQDTVSHMSLQTLVRRIEGSQALIYTVGIIDRGAPGSLDAMGQAALEEMASTSGGRAFFPEREREELGNVIDSIAIGLSHQFAISFVPTNAAKEGKLNKLKLKVKPPPDLKATLYVWAREGYISPPN